MSAGWALPNKAVYTVDESMHILPQGLSGEIAFASAGVGVGYLNDGHATQTSLLLNPHAHPHFMLSGWTKLYHTTVADYWRIAASAWRAGWAMT